MRSSSDNLPESFVRQLRCVRSRIRWVRFAESLGLSLVALLGIYVIFYVLDRQAVFGKWLPLAAFALALTGVLSPRQFVAMSDEKRGKRPVLTGILLPLIWWWGQIGLGLRSNRNLARYLVEKEQHVGDRILSIIELAEGTDSLGSERLRCAAIRQACDEVAQHDLCRWVDVPLWRGFRWYLLGLLLLVGVLWLLYPEEALNVWERLTHPLNPPERLVRTHLKATPESLIVPIGEEVTLAIELEPDSPDREAVGIYYFLGDVRRNVVKPVQGCYCLNLPPIQEGKELVLEIDDVHRNICLIPESRPVLAAAHVGILYPEYMQKNPKTEVLASDRLAVPEGARVSLCLEATQELASATFNGKAQQTEGKRVRVDAWKVESEKHQNTILWTGKNGLGLREPLSVHVIPVKDKPPVATLSRKGGEHCLPVAACSEWEIESADDFGLAEWGLEWRSHHSSEHAEGTSSPDIAGELILPLEKSDETKQKSTYLFSPRDLGLGPQQIELRSFARDRKPGRSRVYSAPVVITLMTDEEHAQMIRQKLDRVIDEAEEALRHMQSLSERVHSAEHAPETVKSDDLTRLADDEQRCFERVQTIRQNTEQLFREAVQYSESNLTGMRRVFDGMATLQTLSSNPLQQARDGFLRASAEGLAESSGREALRQAKEAHDDALRALTDALNLFGNASVEMESGRFLSRLKKMLIGETAIGDELVKLLPQIVGLSASDLTQDMQDKISELTTRQKTAVQEMAMMTDDLKSYRSRVTEVCYRVLSEKIDESDMVRSMEDVQTGISSSFTGKAIDSLRDLTDVLQQCVMLLQDQHKIRNETLQGNRYGETRGDEKQALSDSAFEDILKLLRMEWQEDDILRQTRQAEGMKRQQGRSSL